jgi:hypothetical protein
VAYLPLEITPVSHPLEEGTLEARHLVAWWRAADAAKLPKMQHAALGAA